MRAQILCSIALTGLLTGALGGPAAVAALVCSSLVAAALSTLLSRPFGTLVALVFALGALRGGASGSSPDPLWSTPRGGAPLVYVDVVGPTWPGPHCVVPTRAGDLRMSGGRCAAAAGDGFWVPATAWSAQPFQRGRLASPRAPTMWAYPAADGVGATRSSGDARWPKAWSAWVARRRLRAWEESRGNDARSLSAAVGLGLRSALAPDRRRELAGAGMGHLLAISGLHVALVALAFAALGRRVCTLRGWPHRRLLLPVALLIAAYVLAMGASASATRSGIMAAAAVAGVGWGRPRHPQTTLWVTATAMLLWFPSWVGAIGFQMSVLAIAALQGSGRSPALASWRVTWALAGISAWHFGRIAWVGVLTNLVAIPVFAVAVLPWSILGCLLPAGAASRICFAIAEPGAQLILDLARWTHAVPEPGPAGWIGLGIFALLLRPILLRRRPELEAWIPPRLSALALCAVGIAHLGGLTR